MGASKKSAPNTQGSDKNNESGKLNDIAQGMIEQKKQLKKERNKNKIKIFFYLLS